MDTQTLSRISASLPDRFTFYGYGEVSSRDSTGDLESLTANKIGVSFRVLGSPAALLIVLFENRLDVSMYSELGNILASKLCQKLSEQGEGDLMITPPVLITPTQLGRLSKMKLPFVHRSYQHLDDDRIVPVETLILPISAGGQVGHA
jgi:hypothetical protein